MSDPPAAAQPDDEGLPPPPERPDCCMGGCAVCVLDGYTEELQRWQARCEEIRRLRQSPGTAG